jgi:hypothetical protein
VSQQTCTIVGVLEPSIISPLGNNTQQSLGPGASFTSPSGPSELLIEVFDTAKDNASIAW